MSVAMWYFKDIPTETTQPEPSNSLYVSLGDSVASGLGLPTPGDTTACGRTKEAYPHRLAAAMGYQLVHLACTGATLDAGINGAQLAAGEQIPQRDALFQREPRLITFGVGANDVQWLSVLARCYAATVCPEVEDRLEYERLLETLRVQLRETLRAIGARYGTHPQILVVGYYQVFPIPGTDCQDTAGLSVEGLKWARELRARLNEVVSETVKETGVGTYVEIDFSGHELCTTTPWIQGLADSAPYHANAAGQLEIARQIEKVLRD